MPLDFEWGDIHLEDPDGGTIVLHPVLPTVVYPRKMRTRAKWHVLLYLSRPMWLICGFRRKKTRLNRQEVNLSHGLISGGAFGIFLDEISMVEDVTSGRFPDPEPRRLHRNATRREASSVLH